MKHAFYWRIKSGQNTRGIYTGYGEKRRRGEYTIPLRTLESDSPNTESNRKVFESVRYFKRL